MKSVLITGANGFIGKALLRWFSINEPKTFIRIIEIDDISQNFNILESINNDITCVFHVGALSSTDILAENRVMRYNYIFTKKLIDKCEELNIPIIFSSSASVYGDKDGKIVTPYPKSKKKCEEYAVGKKVVSLRYFNVYGPDESHKNHMASVFYQAFIRNLIEKKPFELINSPTLISRDFVYIKDVVSANIHAYKNTISNGVFDVGTGVSSTFDEMLKEGDLEYIFSKTLKPPFWYQFYTVANEQKFLPGWKPKFFLERGVNEYLGYLNAKYKF